MFGCNVLLFGSGLVTIAGLWTQFRRRARLRPCTFFWGAIFLALFIILPLLSNLIYGPALVPQAWKRAWITSEQVYVIYGVGVFLFSVAYLIASMPWSTEDRAQALRPSVNGDHRIDGGKLRQDLRIMVGLGVLVLVGFGVFVYGTGLSVQELVAGGRFVYYERGTLNLPVVNLGQKLVGLVAVYAFFDAKYGFPKKALSVAVYATVLTFVVITGGRKWIVVVVSGMLAGGYDRRGGFGINLRGVAAFVLAIGIVLAWQVVRYMNLLEAGVVSAMMSRLTERLPLLLWEGDATYFYRASLEAIRGQVELDILYPFALLRRLVFLPFPNEWTFGLKPQGIPLMFADELQHYSEARRGNLPPGLLGIFTLSFGWWAALLIGPVVTLSSIRGVDWIVRNRDGWMRDVLLASFVMIAVFFMRGTEGGFYFLAFNLAVVGAVQWGLTGLEKIGHTKGE